MIEVSNAFGAVIVLFAFMLAKRPIDKVMAKIFKKKKNGK